MNKNEFELRKHALVAGVIRDVLTFLTHALTLGTILGCVYLIFAGLNDMVKQNAESLKALGFVVENLKPSSFIAWAATAIASGGWALERRGKKRLLKQSGLDRKALEKDDAYKGSSGLTETGETPSARGR